MRCRNSVVIGLIWFIGSVAWAQPLTEDAMRKANWARLIQQVYEINPLECANCGTTMRNIALIDDAAVVSPRPSNTKLYRLACSLETAFVFTQNM